MSAYKVAAAGEVGEGPEGRHGPGCSPPPLRTEAEMEALARVGQGSRKLEGWWLKMRQFHGLLVKRFHCARRNSKALCSQILLPAFFVCVAMTVALSVPEIGMATWPHVLGARLPSGPWVPGFTSFPASWRTLLHPSPHPLNLIQGLTRGFCLLGSHTPKAGPCLYWEKGIKIWGLRQVVGACSGLMLTPQVTCLPWSCHRLSTTTIPSPVATSSPTLMRNAGSTGEAVGWGGSAQGRTSVETYIP